MLPQEYMIGHTPLFPDIVINPKSPQPSEPNFSVFDTRHLNLSTQAPDSKKASPKSVLKKPYYQSERKQLSNTWRQFDLSQQNHKNVDLKRKVNVSPNKYSSIAHQTAFITSKRKDPYENISDEVSF